MSSKTKSVLLYNFFFSNFSICLIVLKFLKLCGTVCIKHQYLTTWLCSLDPFPPLSLPLHLSVLSTHYSLNVRGLVNVHLTLSAAYELAISKSIWVPLIG